MSSRRKRTGSIWEALSFRKPAQRAAVPTGVRVYAVGDVHGRADLLTLLFSRIDADLADRPIDRPIQVFLGDYIDRGPASRQALDCLIDRSRSHETICLRGNHEVFLAEFLRNPGTIGEWRQYGGLETLVSYGIVPALNQQAAEWNRVATALSRALPQSHRRFLAALKSFYVCGDFFFAHAGVRPGVSLARQEDSDLLWIRDEFLRCKQDFGKIIVHGHTPVLEPEIHTNRINIDTGAYATGRLTCLRIEADEVSFIHAEEGR